MKHLTIAQALNAAKLVVAVAAGYLEVRGHLSPQLAEVLATLVAAFGVQSLAHAIAGAVKGEASP